jgi:NAD(P)-dependent dehydrogenase (short-subunit alcohol dehydrogenase family)
MSIILITGAATGIGRVTAERLAADGHTVYASMRDPDGRNREHAEEVRAHAQREHVELRVVELDVTSQDSADAAVATVLGEAGQLDVVVHNAGHLYVGYVEAFTAEDIAHLLDVNALGVQRVNRAALPHMRERRSGTLLYIGSTIIVSTPPFLGPYVASKAAFDALAVVTSYEANAFGIETTIVMPGAITKGTQHFPNANRASDQAVTAALEAR